MKSVGLAIFTVIKSAMLTIVALIILMIIYLATIGYNFEYVKLAFGNSCFRVNEYRFCPTEKFEILMIYDQKTKLSYLKGYKPVLNKKYDSASEVMLNNLEKGDMILITLNEKIPSDVKNGCLETTLCVYRETILFGKFAYSLESPKLPNSRLIEVPDLRIRIDASQISDKALNQINISRNL